ncbi:hypothetical protein BU15DRAFT_72704 [Melanogaster broomeanus]|nr:hypothetical protein BU15DRAFT_72704 [Melanogaster broomeanus]
MRLLIVSVVALATFTNALVLRQVPSLLSQGNTPASSWASSTSSAATPASFTSTSQLTFQSASPTASSTPTFTALPTSPAGGDLTTTGNGAVNSPPYTVPINPATYFWTSVSIIPGVSTIHM